MTATPSARGALTHDERRSALVAFAQGTSGHSFGLDDLCDDVIYAAESGHLPHGNGLDAEDRHFVELLYHYAAARAAARLKASIPNL